MRTTYKSYATPSMTREQVADHIAAGFPSPVQYIVRGKTPPHLYRAGSPEARLVRAERNMQRARDAVLTRAAEHMDAALGLIS